MLKIQIKVSSWFHLALFNISSSAAHALVVTSLDQLDGHLYITPPYFPLRLSFPIFSSRDTRHSYEHTEI